METYEEGRKEIKMNIKEIVNDLIKKIIGKNLLKLSARNIQKEEKTLKNETLETINKMVEERDSDAINELAYRYFYGKGIEKNQEKAFELWTDAYYMGNDKATYNLALCLLEGEGINKDEKKAFEILNKLANEKGYIKSFYCLGDIYYYGLGVDVDFDKAIFYYKETLKRDPHNLKAKYSIAHAYYIGTGVKQNYEQAYKMFYDLVYNDNYEEAVFFLGEFYYLGRIVQQNYQKAMEHFNKSLSYNKNVNSSKYYLGEMYLLGRGVDIDCQKAKMYFEDILNENDDNAYYKLSVIYQGKYGTYKNEEKAKEYLEKIEIDLCIALIYYLLALPRKEEHNLNKMIEILNSETKLFKYMLMQIPYKHQAREYHRRLEYLKKEEYEDITNKLKEKINKCMNDRKLSELFKVLDCDEDIIFYATCAVKSYDYPSIDAYIKELLQKKDDAALIFVGKLFINGNLVKEDIKKGLEYLFISKKQSPNISEENRDRCIIHIEMTTKDPEIQYLIGKSYFEIPYYKESGFRFIQKSANQGYLEAIETITNVMEEIRKINKIKHLDNAEYECILEIEKLTKDFEIQLFLVDCLEEHIRENEDYAKYVKKKCNHFIKKYIKVGNEAAQYYLNTKMQEIKNNYKKTRELSEEQLEFIYNYSMNNSEKEKIKELNLQEKIKLLQTNFEQVEYWNNSIKYIEDLGYMVIQWINFWGEGGCSHSGGTTKYYMKLEPTLDFDIAKKKINEIVDEAIKERKI